MTVVSNDEEKLEHTFEQGMIIDLQARSSAINAEVAQLDLKRASLLAEQKRIKTALKRLR